MNKFKYTFWFYVKEHFTKKSLIILGISFLGIIGILFALNHFGGAESQVEIAIVQESNSFVIAEEAFEYLPNHNVHFVDNEDVAREMLNTGDVSDVFIIEGQMRPELTAITSFMLADSEMEMFLTQTLTLLHLETITAQHDLPMDMVIDLTTPIITNLEVIDFEDLIAVEIVGAVIPFVIYMFVLMSGQIVANSVVSEKSSRVMEVMLGKVHPTISMLAKILSSFIGMLLPLIASVLGAVVAHMLEFIELESLINMVNDFISIEVLILTVIVLILGYFCFIFLFAAAGAIANSAESLASVLAPLTYMTMIPFFVSLFVDLDSAIMNILVYVPFVSPFVLVQRFLMGYSTLVEVGIVIVLMIIFAVLALIVSARLYMNGISHTSEKVTFKDLKMLLQK